MTHIVGRASLSGAAAALALLVCLIPACGRKGPPLPPLPVVPVAVGNLRAEPGSGGIVLTWQRPSRNTDGSPLIDLREFRLFRATVARDASGVPPSAYTLFATIRADQPDNARVEGTLYMFRDDAGGKGLSTGRQYRYRVQAANRSGAVGPFSADAVVDFTGVPDRPRNVKASAGDGIVDLEWDAPSGAEPAPKGYNVYRGQKRGEYGTQPINANVIQDRKFRDAGVQNDVEYFYVVRSVSNDRPPWQESADSGEISVVPQDVVPPAPPRGLVAIPGQRDVALTWDAGPERDVLGYLVYRRRVPEVAFTRLTEAPIPGTTYTDRSVQSGATYVYAVTAVDRSRRRNESAPSVEAEAKIP